MNKKLYLSGGGDADQTLVADKEFFSQIKKILYVPVAWDKDDSYKSCIR